MQFDGSPENGGMATKAPEKLATDDPGIISELQGRLEMCIAADGENHTEGMNDLRFLKGEQWPEKQKRSREADGRPVLTINKIPTFLQQVTNDQRQNQSAIKISPVGLNSDAGTSDVMQGMVRYIEYNSNADTACDTAVNSAAAIGFGYFRLVTDYCEEDSFNQEIRFKRIRNPFTVYFDPASVEADGSDATFVIISERISKPEFKAKYPDAVLSFNSFNIIRPGDQGSLRHWVLDNMVRVAEYYRVEFSSEELFQLPDGTTVWGRKNIPQGVQPVASRKSVRRKVMWYLCSPYEIIDRVEIKCKWIPVFPVYGSEIDIDGKVYRNGIIRNARDPATMYNFWMTSATEEVSLRPKTPYIGATGQFKGQEKRWAQANNRSFAYLEYEPVSLEGQLAPPPQRQPMIDVPIGVLAMANHAADNIKATTGLFDSSLGAQGNATSGKQELAQQKQGNVANFHYTDNLNRSRKHAGRCIVNMIPHYYDTERIVRCMGEDGKVRSAWINKIDEAANKIINDVKTGQYDIVVTTGPSYATMRAEAADAMVQFGQSWPKLMDYAGDKVVEAMNWPGASEIAKRIKRAIPPEIANDPDDGGPPPIPPEAQQKIAQLEQQVAELSEKADTNSANVTREEIRKETAIEVAQLNNETKKDVEEIKGWVKLLVEKLNAQALAAEVASDAKKDDTPNEG